MGSLYQLLSTDTWAPPANSTLGVNHRAPHIQRERKIPRGSCWKSLTCSILKKKTNIEDWVERPAKLSWSCHSCLFCLRNGIHLQIRRSSEFQVGKKFCLLLNHPLVQGRVYKWKSNFKVCTASLFILTSINFIPYYIKSGKKFIDKIWESSSPPLLPPFPMRVWSWPWIGWGLSVPVQLLQEGGGCEGRGREVEGFGVEWEGGVGGGLRGVG